MTFTVITCATKDGLIWKSGTKSGRAGPVWSEAAMILLEVKNRIIEDTLLHRFNRCAEHTGAAQGLEDRVTSCS